MLLSGNYQIPRYWLRLMRNTAFFCIIGVYQYLIFRQVFQIKDVPEKHNVSGSGVVYNNQVIPYKSAGPELLVYEIKNLQLTPMQPSTLVHSFNTHRYSYLNSQTRSSSGGLQEWTEDELLEFILTSFTVPTYKCEKMIRTGGMFCTKRPEGHKVLCWDKNVSPITSNNCLVYSIGIGHDFSFDRAMANVGCDVFSFDQDYKHINYPRVVYPGVFFYKVRVGWQRKIEVVTDPGGRFPYIYMPLEDLMEELGHRGAALTVLKIDVENAEWDIFEKHLFKTSILERTQQLALEVHLEGLDGGNQTMSLRATLEQYVRVIKGLQSRGFQLSYFEPNYNTPVTTEMFNTRFHIYFETVWVNSNSKHGAATSSPARIKEFDTLPPIDIIRYNES